MKPIYKKTSVLILLACCVAAVAFSSKAIDNQETKTVLSKTKEKGSSNSKLRTGLDEAQEEDLKYRMEILKANLSNTAETQAAEEEMEQFHRPEEYVKQLNEMSKVVSPYIREEAPNVYDEMLSEQQENRQWTRTAEKDIRTILETPEFSGTSLNDVQCYHTMCKAVFEHENRESYNLFSIYGRGGELAGPSHNFFDIKEDGSGISTFYFAENRKDAYLFDEMIKRLYQKVQGGPLNM